MAAPKEPKPICERIGRMVRERRQSRRLSLAELAEHTGLSKTYLWQIEAGRSEPGAGAVLRLCRKLGLSADDLLGVREES